MKRKILTLLAVLITFTVYILTAAPGVTFTDSGELAGVCSTLGIAHPTGYPLFTILGFLWTLLPLPFSDIYSLNLFAGFVTALSVGVFFNVVYRLIVFVFYYKFRFIKEKSKKRQKRKKVIERSDPGANEIILLIISFTSALLYGFAETIWAQGTSIEVYSLHLLLANLVLWALLKAVMADTPERKKYFNLTALLLGLSFTNHMTTILLVPALIFIYFKRPGERRDLSSVRIKSFLMLFIPFVIGLSVYLYLPIRSANGPEFNWGAVSRGFDKFFYHVTGKQYQVWMFSGENLGANLGKFFALIPYQLAWIGLLPFFVGLVKTWRSRKTIFWFLIILIITCIIYSINYSIHDIDTYFITAFIGILIFTALGLYSLAQSLSENRSRLYSLAFLVLPLLALIMNYGEDNQSDDYLVPEYTRILTTNLDKDALIISSQWDYWCSAFWYKQRVEGYRPDIVLIEKELLRRTWFPYQLRKWYPEVIEKSRAELENYMVNLKRFEAGEKFDTMQIQTDYIRLLRSFIDKNIDNRPIYITAEILQNPSDSIFTAGYAKIPQGFAIRLMKRPKLIPVDFAKLNMDKFIASIGSKTDHLVKGITETASANLAILGRYMLTVNEPGNAKKCFELALRVYPDNLAARSGLRAIQNK